MDSDPSRSKPAATKKSRGLATRAVHTGERPAAPNFTPTVTPIYPGTTYVYDDLEEMDAALEGDESKYVYTRYGNPTTAALEAVVADLEGAASSLAFSSGMAAVHAAIMASVKPGDMIISSQDLYGHTSALISTHLREWGCQVEFVDLTDLDAASSAIDEHQPALVVCETITNPLMKVTDVPAIVGLAKACRATVVVDSTFTTPVVYRPLDDGAHIVVHSMTKYIGGHGDLTGGIVATSRMRRQQLSDFAKLTGGVLGPFESWLALRGIKTMPLRVARQCESALTVAKALAEHPGVGEVNYPGLPDHPSHKTAKRLFEDRGYGAMISFTIKDAGRDEVFRYLDSLELVVPATSLGDIYSLSLYPAMSSHRSVPAEERAKIGIGDDLVRLSIGIEEPEDILADLDRAISAAGPDGKARTT